MSEVEDRANLVLAGRYRLVELIRASAAPEAWRAEMLSGGAVVVFYYPDAAVSGPGAARFLHEAPFLRGVEHPRLVSLIDVGVDTTGAVYGVASAFEGQTLAERVEKVGALPLADAVRVVCDALSGLGALHERGLVHRGITSAEVLLERDAAGQVRGRLLLGGALGVIARGAGRMSLSSSNRAFGSPHHLAPEQCRGQEVTPETDVWAMGVVLHEAFSGAVPFDGETPLEVIAAVLGDAPPVLASRAPAPVLGVLRQALSKRTGDRPPDAEAMCLMLSAAARELPADEPAARPSIKPTPARLLKSSGISRGQAAEFAADDLDALVATVKSEATPATDFDLDFHTVVAPVAPAVDVPLAPPADFDLDFGAPTDLGAPMALAIPGEALPPPPPVDPQPALVLPQLSQPALSLSLPASPSAPPAHPPSAPAAGFSFSLAPAVTGASAPAHEAPLGVAPRDSITHTALTPEVVDRTKAPRVQRARAVNPYAAFLGVAAVTGLLGYAGWKLSGAEQPRQPPAFARAPESPSPRPTVEPHAPRGDGAAAGDGGEARAGDAPVDDHASDAPRPENQTPAEFGEQLLIAMPSLPRDAAAQFIRHVATAAAPDAATVTGFASCADQTLYLHPGGLVPQMRSAPLDARCDALDLALIPDVDGDRAADVAAVAADSAGLVVIGSRNFRVVKRIPLAGSIAVVAGLSRAERRRSEPVVVTYVAPRGGGAALVAVGVKSGRTYWRTDPSFTPGFARDYGLSVGPDADGDGAPDVAVGLLRDGTRCVTVLSGATGAPVWRAPRCFDGASAQTLSFGADVNDDRRGDLALGNAVEGRVRVLSGSDGRELRSIEPSAPGEGMTFGPWAVLMPDIAQDGFPDLAVPRTQSGEVSVEVFSANDQHRLGRRELAIREGAADAVVRVHYAENFGFAGSRSLLVASALGVAVLGAAPRPEIRDPAAGP